MNYSGITPGVGTITNDAFFINIPNDFNLQSASPCIDAADPADTDGLQNGPRYDMGALESPYANVYAYNIDQNQWYSTISLAVSAASNNDVIEVYVNPAQFNESINITEAGMPFSAFMSQ